MKTAPLANPVHGPILMCLQQGGRAFLSTAQVAPTQPAALRPVHPAPDLRVAADAITPR